MKKALFLIGLVFSPLVVEAQNLVLTNARILDGKGGVLATLKA